MSGSGPLGPLVSLAEIFICKQRNNKILTWYGRRHDMFGANRPFTGVTITFIRCLYRVTGVSIGQGVNELMMLNEYQSQGHSLTLVKGHSDFKVKTCFLINSWGIWNQNSYESFRENRNENSYK